MSEQIPDGNYRRLVLPDFRFPEKRCFGWNSKKGFSVMGEDREGKAKNNKHTPF
jgi:hypothetical protein